MAVSGVAYQQAVDAIEAVSWRGIKPGLERTAALLSALGEPQRGLSGVLVAGTNGKGSVCAVVDAVCRAAGLRTVLLTKPHLHSYRERIVVDGRMIDEDGFARVVGDAVDAAATLPEELGPTGFELLTAASILAASRAACQVLVCEVGLGGRLDSTNVLDLGVAVITNVALDHQEHLGSRVVDIAGEKAAIIKPGNIAVSGAEPEAMVQVSDRAAAMGATLRVVYPAGRALGFDGVEVNATFDGRPLRVRSPLLGGFQVANIATAVATCDALRETGTRIDAAAVTHGCAAAVWPGRMQLLPGEPAMLVDGAHNPAGMAAMVASARELFAGRRVVAVFAAMRDKDAAAMAAELQQLTKDVVVTAPDVQRAADPAQLASHFDAAHINPDVATAIAVARERAGPAGVVVVCGSLFLVAEALRAPQP